jgi:hypothetical protein
MFHVLMDTFLAFVAKEVSDHGMHVMSGWLLHFLLVARDWFVLIAVFCSDEKLHAKNGSCREKRT